MNAPARTAPPVTHYENFPVASWLCPPRLRPAVAALYHLSLIHI
ncbi:MAG: squalene synthase HpnC, partial [Caldimonas manganoxidans]|nr:squalene synthase HpnC [Caldimonas manganoxidans]